MKIRLFITALIMMMSTNFAFASFPVERNAAPSSTTTEVSVNKKETYTAVMASEKSQGIALILALLLGLLAAHRWYLGTPWIWNIFFILTFGGLGIWLLIDIIRICTGDLGPAKGRYKKDFF